MAATQSAVTVNVPTADGKIVPVLLLPGAATEAQRAANSFQPGSNGEMVSLDLDNLQEDPVGLREPQISSEVAPTFGT